MNRKLKLVRLVTASFVVPWHMHNMLARLPRDFDVVVAGQGVSEHRAAYPDIEFVNININRKNSMGADLFALFALIRFLLKTKPDIVHSIMPKAGLLAAIAGFICRVPARIHTFTGQTWAGRAGWSYRLYWALDWWINRLNHVCLTDSPSQSEFLARHGITRQGRALPVLSAGSLSGVDLARFDRAALRDASAQLKAGLGLGAGHRIVAYIARKTLEKGALDMLQAFASVVAQMPQARLLFVGPDEDGVIAGLRATRPALFHQVIEVGAVSNHEAYLAAADILCLPSYREGFGSVVIEAAALGLPTVGSRIPGLTDSVVDGVTGLLVPAGDLSAFSGALVDLFNDPARLASLGRQAKTRVDACFSADTLYAELSKLYKNPHETTL